MPNELMSKNAADFFELLLEQAKPYITNVAPSVTQLQQALEQTGARLTLEKCQLLSLELDDLRLSIDFNQGDYAHRQRFGGGRQQLLARAIGLHKKPRLKVLDATAGLAKDSFVLANLGAEVHMIEHSPVLLLLLAHALAHYQGTASLSLYWGNARQLLPQLAHETPAFDIIYLDPMYPQNRSAALPKKGAQILRALAHCDRGEEGELLELARQQVAKVVVKRPKAAPYLADIPPQQELKGKNTRYDLYL